jgi:hypothetical protein
MFGLGWGELLILLIIVITVFSLLLGFRRRW